MTEYASHESDLEREYRATVSALSVAIEMLQQLTGSDFIQLSDRRLRDLPDLDAWRDSASGRITMRATR